MTKIANHKNTGENINKKFYFASANTCFGFKSYFSYIFNPELLKKIYIIKGGSGTGKSYLMNEIATKAVEKNLSVECFLCSSDPGSLDGIIINELGTAVIDGTAPHITDPKYPGVIENIINIGDFWDEEKLDGNKDKIFELTNKKSVYFSSAYKYLKAANEILESVNDLSKKYINHEKIEASVHRIINKHIKGKNLNSSTSNANRSEYRFINAISPNGCETLDTFEQDAKKIFYISNENFTGSYYTESLLNQLKNRNKIILPFALNPEKTQGIYLKDTQILFVIKDKIADKVYDERYNFINMDRFVDANFKKEHKYKLRIAKKCCNAVIDSAIEYLKGAKNLHFELEDIYKSAMNFDKKGKYSKDLIRKIFT